MVYDYAVFRSACGNTDISWQTFSLFSGALPIASSVCFLRHQESIEAGIALIAKRPDEQAKGIVLAVMVETYAILALLATVLAVLNIH